MSVATIGLRLGVEVDFVPALSLSLSPSTGLCSGGHKLGLRTKAVLQLGGGARFQRPTLIPESNEEGVADLPDARVAFVQKGILGWSGGGLSQTVA